MKLDPITTIKNILIGGYPVVAIETWEEKRTTQTLKNLSDSVFQSKGEFIVWDLENGIANLTTNTKAKCPAIEALEAIEVNEKPGFFIFKDLEKLLDSPDIIRRIKNINNAFRGQNKFLFLVGTEFIIPPDCRKDIFLVNYALPNASEIEITLDSHLKRLEQKGISINLLDTDKTQAINALKGFTSAEIMYSLNKASWGRKEFSKESIEILRHEKEQLARKSGILEYVRASDSLDDVGGLENLKDWLVKRQKLFSPEAAKMGIKPPKGLLMMGISGCGKSLSVKAISSLWNLPLFRLDMNKVYSGVYGSPEGTFHQAIKASKQCHLPYYG